MGWLRLPCKYPTIYMAVWVSKSAAISYMVVFQKSKQTNKKRIGQYWLPASAQSAVFEYIKLPTLGWLGQQVHDYGNVVYLFCLGSRVLSLSKTSGVPKQGLSKPIKP